MSYISKLLILIVKRIRVGEFIKTGTSSFDFRRDDVCCEDIGFQTFRETIEYSIEQPIESNQFHSRACKTGLKQTLDIESKFDLTCSIRLLSDDRHPRAFEYIVHSSLSISHRSNRTRIV